MKYGLPTDRVVAALAVGFSALCRLAGANISPEEFIPKFDKPKELPDEVKEAILEGMKKRKQRHETRGKKRR